MLRVLKWIWIIQKYHDFVIKTIDESCVGEKEKASSELIFGAFYPCENSVQPSLRQQLSTLKKYHTIFAQHTRALIVAERPV